MLYYIINITYLFIEIFIYIFIYYYIQSIMLHCFLILSTLHKFAQKLQSTILLTIIFFCHCRKKRSVLEYLDLCTDPPPPVPSHASCYTRMHSYTQSACDCYCRTRVPIARRREEVHCERSRVRGSRSSVLKMETARSAAKRVPLIAAKVVDDEQVLQVMITRTLRLIETLNSNEQ